VTAIIFHKFQPDRRHVDASKIPIRNANLPATETERGRDRSCPAQEDSRAEIRGSSLSMLKTRTERQAGRRQRRSRESKLGSRRIDFSALVVVVVAIVVVVVAAGTEKASDSPSMSHRVYWDYKACRGRRAGRRDLFELFKLDTKLNACSARVQVMTALAYKW